jgi:hypothetical protein
MILDGPPDRLESAQYEIPSKVRLVFADGRTGVWSFHQLGLNMTNMKPASIKVAASGTCLKIRSRWGANVEIDAFSLRAMIDREYAGELEKAFVALRGPIKDLKTTGVHSGIV